MKAKTHDSIQTPCNKKQIVIIFYESSSKERILYILVHYNMIKNITLLLFISTLVISKTNNKQERQCLNGGKCTNNLFYTPCQCSPLYIGKYCQTKAKKLKDNVSDNIGYIDLTPNFQHFVFSPDQGNYIKFNFNVCSISNLYDLETLIYLTADQEDGGATYEPPIISAAKIKSKVGICMTFSSPYIQINKDFPKPFRRIIMGVRTLQKSIKNYFYRTITGKYLYQIPDQILDNQPLASSEHLQRFYVTFQSELYKQAFMQTVIRKFIKVLIGIGGLLAFFLFCRIALFSYGIDIKILFIYLFRAMKKIIKKIGPFKGDTQNYQNYLKYKAKHYDEEELKLIGKDQCAICIQSFLLEDMIQQTVCRHIYHQNCIEEWEQKNQICPLCRTPLVKMEGKWIFQENKD